MAGRTSSSPRLQVAGHGGRRFKATSTDEEEGSSSSSSTTGEEPEILIRTWSVVPIYSEDRTFQRFSELIEERCGLRMYEVALRVATVVWLFTGLYAVMYCGRPEERQDAISAMYLMVQLITTVGYGDILPKSMGMKWFMACFVFVGNILAALVITERLQKFMSRSHDILKENTVTTMVEDSQRARGIKQGIRRPHASFKPRNKYGGVICSFFVYVLFVLGGAIFYGVMFTCLCPQGGLDCAEDIDCEEAGGYQRDIADGFYMAVVTLTTVGFGDESPTSTDGRLFGIFWMLFGVAAMANFLAEVAHLVLVQKLQSVADVGISHDLFRKIDQDGSGTLTKFEFVTYMLVKYGLVSEQDLDLLLSEFNGFDTDNSGELTYEEICPDTVHSPKASS